MIQFAIIEPKYSKSYRNCFYKFVIFSTLITFALLVTFILYLEIPLINSSLEAFLYLFLAFPLLVMNLLVYKVIDKFKFKGILIFNNEKVIINFPSNHEIFYNNIKFIRLKPELSGASRPYLQKSYTIYITTTDSIFSSHITREQFQNGKLKRKLIFNRNKDIFDILKEKKIKHGIAKR